MFLEFNTTLIRIKHSLKLSEFSSCLPQVKEFYIKTGHIPRSRAALQESDPSQWGDHNMHGGLKTEIVFNSN